MDDIIILKSTVQDNNAVADGKKENTIIYHLTRNGVPYADEYLKFSAVSSGGHAALSSAFGQTDAGGNFVLNVTNTEAEKVMISASPAIDGLFQGAVDTLVFSNVEASYHLESTLIENNAAADGISQNKVSIKVLDSLGNPVREKLLQFLPSTNLTLADRFLLTDAEGKAVVSCTARSEGDFFISVEIYGEKDMLIVNGISFSKADELNALTSHIIGDKVDADGKAYCEILYILTKKSAHNVNEKKEISIVLQSVTAYPSRRTLTTDDSGTATLYVYNTVAEPVIVSAYTDDDNIVSRTKVHFVTAA